MHWFYWAILVKGEIIDLVGNLMKIVMLVVFLKTLVPNAFKHCRIINSHEDYKRALFQWLLTFDSRSQDWRKNKNTHYSSEWMIWAITLLNLVLVFTVWNWTSMPFNQTAHLQMTTQDGDDKQKCPRPRTKIKSCIVFFTNTHLDCLKQVKSPIIFSVIMVC